MGGYVTWAFLAVIVGLLLIATFSLIALAFKAAPVLSLTGEGIFILRYYSQEERDAFLGETWWLTKRIFPLLVVGTLITGIIGYFVPIDVIRAVFGTSGFLACFTASVIGAVLYMPTRLEVLPIVGTFFGYSAGIAAPGADLALFLAAPSLSLPNMIVIWRIIGARRTGLYVSLVVILSTAIGMMSRSNLGVVTWELFPGLDNNLSLVGDNWPYWVDSHERGERH